MSVSSGAGRVVLAFALLLLSGRAKAGDVSDGDRATARELGAAGLAALDAHDYATALDRLSRALALYDVPTLRLGRARALRATGQLVSASENYRAVVLRGTQKGDPPAFVQAQRDANRELTQVEKQIAHLTITVRGTPASLRVDGEDWPAVAIGIPRPLDPGVHVVETTNASQQVQSQKVMLSPGQNERLEIAVATAKPQPDTAVPTPSPPPAFSPTLASTSTSPALAAPEPTSPNRAPAVVATVITGALVATAVITGLIAMSDKSDYNEQNRPDVPQSTKNDLRSKASTMAAVSTVLTGAALVGAGVSIYFWASPGHSEAGRAERSTTTGVIVTMRF